MSKIPTTEELLKDKTQFGTYGNMYKREDVSKKMIEFAKLHVDASKKEFLKYGFGRYMEHAFDKDPTRVPIDEDSISNVYPLENIK